MTTAAEQDGWRELLSLLLSSSLEEDHVQTSALCRTFLDTYATAAGAENDNDGGADVPADVVATVRTTYVRSLLNLQDHAAVVEYCRSFRQASSSGGGGSGSGTGGEGRDVLHLRQEEAYAQYRLKNYAKARDLCRSALKAAGCDPDDLTTESAADGNAPLLGLMHVYGQALYRLHETRLASRVYRFLRSAVASDDEEMGEVMTNALAVVSANVTYCGSSAAGSADGAIGGDEDAILEQIDGNGVGRDYDYDLARNYANLLLLRATSASELARVVQLLRQAEEGGQIALDDEEEDQLTEEEVERELAPIRADLATAQQLLGDRQAASRAYFQLMQSGDPALQFVAKHNLAVLSSAANPAAALKQMPDLSDESVSSKLTPAQLRTVLLNRALLALANKKHDDARKALAALRAAVTGGGTKKARRKGAGSSAAAARQPVVPPAPPARKDVDGALWSSRTALVESELLRAERKAGEAAAVLRAAMEDLAAAEGALEDGSSDEAEAIQFGMAALALHKLEVDRQSALEPDVGSDDEVEEEEEEKDGNASPPLNPIDVLSGLPKAIMTRPAVLGALSSLYSQAGQEEKVAEIIDMLSSSSAAAADVGGSGDAETAKIKSSQYIKSGRYEDAIEVLRAALDGDANLSEETRMELTARLVQALSYVDPAEAEELVASLEDGEASVVVDGDELESRETPRLGKGGGVPAGAKIGGDFGGESQERNGKRQTILHRRARKRDTYLQKLEDEGRYDPDKPSKADPERWIPKAQRSYNRRGRRGRQRFVGAQGGGTGAGADRDAAKLDAAARAAAKREGIAYGPSKASTAHMEVAGGGASARRKGGRR